MPTIFGCSCAMVSDGPTRCLVDTIYPGSLPRRDNCRLRACRWSAKRQYLRTTPARLNFALRVTAPFCWALRPDTLIPWCWVRIQCTPRVMHYSVARSALRSCGPCSAPKNSSIVHAGLAQRKARETCIATEDQPLIWRIRWANSSLPKARSLSACAASTNFISASI